MVGIVMLSMAVVLVLIGVVGIFAGRDYKYGNSAVMLGIVSIILSILCLVGSMVTVVPARTVGVKIAFGKPVGVVENGLHFKAPWTGIEKLDLAVQNDVYNGESAIDVRLANSSKGRVDASIQWQLKPEGAQETFMDYRSFESIQSNLVDRNFRATLNEVLADYDPLAVVQDGAQEQELAKYADKVSAELGRKVGDRIEVRSVTIPIINFDESTQRRIDELVSEFANTRVAQQKQQTSQAEAQANRALQESISPDVLTNKCLDIVRDAGGSPLGCFPSNAFVQAK
ncbi:SPFH domain / Band 7 family [Chlamydia trachomatis]|nr:SPFH domain / Band 7 family [Chlamydia trachomatis]